MKVYDPEKVYLVIEGEKVDVHSTTEVIEVKRPNITLQNLWELPEDHPDYSVDNVKVISDSPPISFILHRDSESLKVVKLDLYAKPSIKLKEEVCNTL